ncbi:uncharacterized protein LOC121878397 isoform X2 [Homarus americanus]|uniref:uncharacterized protein LOC121878397 isoform X2 n=1 Tax=Homarus americanus TaxID=6706 RepID=UPI001C43F35C|nr:uncharacterized protein LOC121878397 isoform X2 [Homarus americanus]
MRLRNRIFRLMLRVLQRAPGPVYKWVWWCKHTLPDILASHRYRALVLSSLLLIGIVLLSIPNVPERFLGIRSPERILESFNFQQNTSTNESERSAQPVENKIHLLQKRHIPHKFWARARPHNKFVRKKGQHNSQHKVGPAVNGVRALGKSMDTHH